MEKENQLLVNPKEFGLEETKALTINKAFEPKLIERDGLMNVYENLITKEINEETCKEARELRLKLVKVRTGIASAHKTEKEFYLASGKYIDALKNRYTLQVEQMEEKLSEIEKYYENLEKEKNRLLHEERLSKISKFGYEVGNIDFSGMDEQMFNTLLNGAEKSYNDRIEAERIAEEKRLEAIRLEEEEREKQRIEMERLRKENEEKEALLKAEKEKAEKEAAELKAKADAELKEQKRLAEIEAKKQAEILAKQKAEADKLAAELKAKQEAELKEKQRIEAENKAKLEAEKKAAKAPDKDKLNKWLSELELLSIDLKQPESNEIAIEIKAKFEGFKKWAIEKINTL